MESHSTALKRIGRFLAGTRDKGIIFSPTTHSFECYVDADFVGNWDQANADIDPGTAKLRTGYIIMYGGCPMIWASKLQKEVTLSTTEAEYNALSESLREVISTMQLLEETRAKLQWNTCTEPPQVHCKVLEDNSGALEMSNLPKMRPRTKHICVRMHHFREYVQKRLISIHKIASRFQLADIATKPQPVALFVEQRESLMKWEDEVSLSSSTPVTPIVPAVVTSTMVFTRSHHQHGPHMRACDVNGIRDSLLVSQPHMGVTPASQGPYS